MRTAEAIRIKNTWLQLSPNNYTNLHTKIVASYKEHVFLSKIKNTPLLLVRKCRIFICIIIWLFHCSIECIKLQEKRMKLNSSLNVCIIFILCPFYWVFVNILPYLLIINIITNNVVMV